jgi:HSP20 family protein
MTRLSVYDPFAEVFPEVFRGFFQPTVERRTRDGGIDVRIDVSENPREYMVRAEMPGAAKEDIQVQIDGNRVSIAAEVKRESEQKNGDRVLRSERYYGTMSRTFALAAEVDESAADARYEAGVLTLKLPKKAQPAARRLEIH